MIRMSGLWLKERENGEKYFTGSIGGMAFKIFKNTYKNKEGAGENEPDYILYMDENKPQKPVVTSLDDDIPF